MERFYTPIVRKAITVTATMLDAYTGKYVEDKDTVTIVSNNDRIMLYVSNGEIIGSTLLMQRFSFHLNCHSILSLKKITGERLQIFILRITEENIRQCAFNNFIHFSPNLSDAYHRLRTYLRTSLTGRHRFPMLKYELIPGQLLHEGVITEANIFLPEPLAEDIILRTHTKEYWQRMKLGELTAKEMSAIVFRKVWCW